MGVLGPLEIRRAGRPVDLTVPMLRAMLGLLAVRPGRIVSVSELVDGLWEDDPPRTCRALVHTYVSNLRRLLEPGLGGRSAGRRLRREPAGYRLLLGPAESDAAQFRDLTRRAAQARAGGAHQSAWQLYAEALDCWRGQLPERLAWHPDSIALNRSRLSATLTWADLGLGFGYYSRVVPVLQVLAAEEPLHEGVTARLMLALAGDGQQAAALSLFGTIRERLDSALGMTPGSELREAHLRVLRGRLPIAVPPLEPDGVGETTPARAGGRARAGRTDRSRPLEAAVRPPVAPAQLPADIPAFTGREAELSALDELLTPAGPAGPDLAGSQAPLIAVVTGMAGVGKTALALHWAHRARHLFPGGQLFADLRGQADDAARPIDVLAGFLSALGVPPEAVPADQDQASALLRSCLDGKRALVVLDNASTARQARPLLLASPGSATLITARERLTGLAARNGAALLTVAALPQTASAALLTQVIGHPRADAEPDAIAALAELCAHLPLALRIAAANLNARPAFRLADYVARLTAGDRLTALSVEGDRQTAVRGAFESACDALAPADRRLFSLAGIAPGRDLPVDAAAALAGTGLAEAELSLDRLAARNLLIEHSPGRYKFHDLLRLYAASLAGAELHGPERAAALDRLARHLMRRVRQAVDQVFPHRLHLNFLDGEGAARAADGGPPAAMAGPAGFPDPAAAIAWLEAERANLVVLAEWLVGQGSPYLALHVADSLCTYFMVRLDVVDFDVVIVAAQRAATAVADPTALAAVALWQGSMHDARSRFADSARDFASAVELARRSGWTDGEAVALNNLARSRWMAGDVGQSIAGWREALTVNRRSGRAVGEAVTLANLGAAHLQLARFGLGNRADDPVGEAMRLLGQALDLHREIGDRRNEAATLRLIAQAHRERGDQRRALNSARQSLLIAAETGDPRCEIEARGALGTILAGLGDAGPALAEHRSALRQARDVGNLQTEAAALLELADTHALLSQPDDALLALRDAESLAALTRTPMLERQIRWMRGQIADSAQTAVSSAAVPHPWEG